MPGSLEGEHRRRADFGDPLDHLLPSSLAAERHVLDIRSLEQAIAEFALVAVHVPYPRRLPLGSGSAGGLEQALLELGFRFLQHLCADDLDFGHPLQDFDHGVLLTLM